MENVTIRIDGMTCQGCVRSVKKVLETVPGVQEVEVSLERGEAQVRFDPAAAGVDRLRQAVNEAGYTAAD